MTILGRSPAAWLGAIAAVLNLAVGLGLRVTGGQVTAINAALAAIVAAAGALAVRPISIPVLVAAGNALAAVAVAFGAHIAETQIGLGDAALVAVLTLALHQTPTASRALRRLTSSA